MLGKRRNKQGEKAVESRGWVPKRPWLVYIISHGGTQRREGEGRGDVYQKQLSVEILFFWTSRGFL